MRCRYAPVDDSAQMMAHGGASESLHKRDDCCAALLTGSVQGRIHLSIWTCGDQQSNYRDTEHNWIKCVEINMPGVCKYHPSQRRNKVKKHVKKKKKNQLN